MSRFNRYDQPKQGQAGQRVIVTDVPTTTNASGASQENDVMRKLAINVNSALDDLHAKVDAITPEAEKPKDTKNDTTGGGGDGTGKQKALITEHNSIVVVPDTSIMNFIDRFDVGGVIFSVDRIGSGEADIRGHVILPPGMVNTMWGTRSGGYNAEVPNNNSGYVMPLYAKAAFSAPMSPQRNRTLLHFIGDGLVQEPARYFDSGGANTRVGFGADRPSLESSIWAATSQQVTVAGEMWDVTAVKTRIWPNLQFFDPDESTHTSAHVTRVFFKESATAYPAIGIDATVTDVNYPFLNEDPREYSATVTIDVKDDAFSAQNLGSAGAGKVEVYKTQVGRVFYFRRLQQGSHITLSQDADYVTIATDLVGYLVANVGTGAGKVWRDTTGTDPKTINLKSIKAGTGITVSNNADDITINCSVVDANTTYDHLAVTASGGAYIRLHGSDSSTDDILLRGAGGTTVSYINDSIIEVSSTDTDTTYTYYAVSSSGVKLRLHSSTSVDNDVELTSSDGSVVITYVDAHTIDFVSVGSGGSSDTYAIDNVGSGAGVWRNTTISGSVHTSHLRRINAGTNISVTENTDDITISCTLVDTNTTYDHLFITATGGAKLRLHASTGVNDDVLIRGAGATTVTYIDADTIEISSTDTDTNNTYAIDNCASGTGAGLIYHDSTIVGSLETFHLRHIKAGTGVSVSTVGHDVIIDCTVTDTDHTYAIDNCSAGTGTGLIYHDSTIVGSLETFHLRKLLAGTGINISTAGHDVTIACSIVDTNTLYDHLVVTATAGAKLRLHGSTGSTDDVLFTSAGNTVLISRTDDDTMNFEVNLDLMPYNVIGANIDNCTITSAPYGWYIDYSDDAGTHTRTLRFKKFKGAHDFIVTPCVDDYIFDVNILGQSLSAYYDIYYGKTGSTLQFRGIRPGTGITMEYVDDDPTTGIHDVLISCSVVDTNTTYDHLVVSASGGAKIRLHGSDSSTDDIAILGFGSVAVSRYDDDTIYITGTDNDHTYAIDNCSAGTGAGLLYHDSTVSGSLETFHLRHIKAGSGMTVSTSGHDVIVACDISDTNTTYEHFAVSATGGAYIRLFSSDGYADDILLQGDGSTIVSYVDADTIRISSTDTNTTYDHLAVTAAGGAKIRLHGSTGSNDDILLYSSDASVTIARVDDDTINFTTALPWSVVGHNDNDCTVADAPYTWYIGYSDDSGTHTRTLKFRTFAVMHDLKVTPCVSDYIFDVNILASNLTSFDDYDLYYDKDDSTLQFRGLRAGSGISLNYIDDDPTTGVHVIEISSTITDTDTTYSVANVGTGVGKVWRDTTSGSPNIFNLKSIKAGSGISITNGTDDITITSTSSGVLYSLSVADGVSPGDVVVNLNGTDSSVDSFVIFGSGGTSVSRSGDRIEINSQPIVTYDHQAYTDGSHVYLRLNGSDSSTDDIEIAGSGGITVSYVSDDKIEVSASFSDSVAVVDNCSASGAQVFHDTTVSGSTTTYHLRRLRSGSGVTVTEGTHDIVFDCTVVDHTTSLSNVGSGAQLVKTPSVVGTNTDYPLRSIVNTDGNITITQDTNTISVDLAYAFSFKVTASGLDHADVTWLVVNDATYDIHFTHDTITTHKSTITPKNFNYSTKFDTVNFISGGSTTTDKDIANDTWEPLYFGTAINIDGPSWVHQDTSTSPYFWFKPDDAGDDHIYIVSVRMFFVSRNTTDNTVAASIAYPEMALFIDDTFYQTLDVDLRVGEFATTRAYLALSDPLIGASIPESGSKAWLHGTATVRLRNNTDKLNVRFKHVTGINRYIKLKEGSIDISKIAIQNTAGGTISTPISHTQF